MIKVIQLSLLEIYSGGSRSLLCIDTKTVFFCLQENFHLSSKVLYIFFSFVYGRTLSLPPFAVTDAKGPTLKKENFESLFS